jgi:DinB family
MNTLEYCRQAREREIPKFLKVLMAIPAGNHGYKPDPKSRTAPEIAWLLASSESALASLLDTGTVEWKETPAPADLASIIAAFEKNAAAVDERLKRFDEARWGQKGKFLFGEGQSWEDTYEAFTLGFLFDSIHHRGQLTTYLRAMGGKVPSIYGPSADDSGQ